MPIGHVTCSLVRSRHRLTGTSMTPETADRWLDAWVVGATGLGLGRTDTIGRPAGRGSRSCVAPRPGWKLGRPGQTAPPEAGASPISGASVALCCVRDLS
jgi:hypothetical protein